MENKNIQIVREYIDEIINAKHFDRIYQYYSEQCVFYSTPYVGLGVVMDDSSGERLIVRKVAAGSPVAGVLQPGDELVRAADDHGAWEGFEQLRTGMWGQGKSGTEVTLSLLRDGKTFEASFKRGRVEGFHITMAEIGEMWEYYYLKELPDLHTEIVQIFGSGDLVAYFAINTATNALYQQSAVWSECIILRLENERIVQWWGVEDQLSQWRQFGFQMIEPAKVLV